MNWFNFLASAIGAGVAAGALSVQTQPVQPWQVHAGAAVTGALFYAAGHLRKSPKS